MTGSADAQLPAAREMRSAAAAALVAAGGDDIAGAIEILEIWVAAKLGLRGTELHTTSNSVGARGRGLVGCLANEHGLCSAAAVARYFERAKATLSEQMAARRASAADRQILATPVDRVIKEALALRLAQAKLAAPSRE